MESALAPVESFEPPSRKAGEAGSVGASRFFLSKGLRYRRAADKLKESRINERRLPMERVTIAEGLSFSRFVAGMLHLPDFGDTDAARAHRIEELIEMGVTTFDHADYYADYEAEKAFGRFLASRPGLRSRIELVTKCGNISIQNEAGETVARRYDTSYEHILASVEGSLKRLQTDCIDLFLLHRIDHLADPRGIAQAFSELRQQGKVRYFGVSNHKPSQIQLLKKYVKQDIAANQLQLSIPNSNMITNGMEVNMLTDGAADRDGSVLDFCRLNDITIQTWSPFQYGFFEGVFLGNDKFEELNKLLKELAEKYNTTDTAIAAAWIMRHPAGMQLVAGTMKLSRLQEICRASEIVLTREEWYQIYLAGGHILP